MSTMNLPVMLAMTVLLEVEETILLFTAVLEANYTITNNGGGTYSITDNVGSEGTDTLTTMEFAKFSDVTVNPCNRSNKAQIGATTTRSRILHAVTVRL